jgi:hypothetical protein
MVKLMKIPKAIFRQTDSTQDINKLMNSFFVNTKEYVKSRLENSIDNYFEIKSANLSYNSNEINSDNRISYLEFKEKYILAGMLETRTTFNNLQFTFFRDLSCLEKIG